jgi:methyl-accepting chemotaxis protein
MTRLPPERPSGAAPAAGVPGAAGAQAVARRVEERRRNRFRLAGAVLLVYGLVGAVLFSLLAVQGGQPIGQLAGLAETVEEQRGLAVEVLDQAAATLSQAASGVGTMDTSLARVQVVTGQAATISSGVGTSMHQLAETMQLDVLGVQPFVGLGAGFEDAATNLDRLSADLDDVGSSLADSRRDAVEVGRNLTDLSLAVARLSDAIHATPSLEIGDSIGALSLLLMLTAAWLILLSLACAAAGGWLLWLAQRRPIAPRLPRSRGRPAGAGPGSAAAGR